MILTLIVILHSFKRFDKIKGIFDKIDDKINILVADWSYHTNFIHDNLDNLIKKLYF